MYFPTVLFLALVAVVTPVLSVPVVPQPSAADLTPAEPGIVPGFFTTDTAVQSALKRALVPIHESPEGWSEHERRQLGELLGGLLARSSPAPEPTHFCLMVNANNGNGCDTAQCKSGGGSCNLNPSTNRCNMSNMRGKSAPFACLGCKCQLETTS